MAASLTNISTQSGGSETDAASYNTGASWTPLANRKYYLFVQSWEGGSSPPSPTVTGNSMTWNRIFFENFAVTADVRISVYEGFGTSPTAGVTTMSFSGVQLSIRWSMNLANDVDISSTVVQIDSDEGDSNALSITLGAFSNAANLYVACFCVYGNNTITPEGTLTQVSQGGSVQQGRQSVCYRLGGADLSASASVGVVTEWVAVGIELKGITVENTLESMAIATASAIELATKTALKANMGKEIATAEQLVATYAANALGDDSELMGIAMASAIMPQAIVLTVEEEIVFNTDQAKDYFYKVYNQAGNFVNIFPATGLPTFSWPINGGISTITYQLPRPYGQAGEHGEPSSADNLDLGHMVDTIVVDREAPLGIKIHSGLIEEYEIEDPSTGPIPVTIVPLVTRFTDRFIYGPIDFTDTDPTNMVKYFIDNGYLPSVSWNLTNPLVGQLFTQTFLKQRVGEILERIRKLAGSNWFWRLDADNILTFKKFSLKGTPTHSIVGTDFSKIRYIRSRIDKKQRVFVFGAESHDEFGFLIERIEGIATAVGYDPNVDPRDMFHTDSRITDNATAIRIASYLLEFHNQDNIETEIEIIDSNHDPYFGYDIESLRPGDTLQVFNPNQVYNKTKWGLFKWNEDEWNTNFAGLIQGPLVIANVDYRGTHAVVKLTNKPAAFIEELVNVQDRQLLEGST